MKKNEHAAALGRMTSDKKAASSRENGRKGGRPRHRRLEAPEPLMIRHHKGVVWKIQGEDTGTVYETSEDVGGLKRLMNRTHRPPTAFQDRPDVWFPR